VENHFVDADFLKTKEEQEEEDDDKSSTLTKSEEEAAHDYQGNNSRLFKPMLDSSLVHERLKGCCS
jgi:hypothetical protein